MPQLTAQNFWIPCGVILLVGYLSYMGIWVVVKTVQKNKNDEVRTNKLH
jgi:hypothetical protein